MNDWFEDWKDYGHEIDFDLTSNNDQIRLRDVSVVQYIKDFNKKLSIDIGANEGFYTIFLAKYSKQVLAIEPFPHTVELLIRTLDYWNLKNVQVVSAVIASEDGYRNLYLSYYSGLHTISPAYVDTHLYDHKPEAFIKVPSYKLDTIAKDLDVGLIKIDVEGAEEEVLLSAKETLHRCHPVLLLETHPTSNFDRIDDYLKQFGYNIKLNGEEILWLEPSKNYVCY